MNISDILDAQSIVTDIQATDKEGILQELVGHLAKVKDLGDKKAIVKSLIERENLGSTGIGQGIAIPHGKTDKISEISACLGISRQGVNFDALDGELVYIFFLLVAPKDSAGPHLKALAKISRLLRDDYFCKLLRNSDSEKDIFDLVVQEEVRRS